MLKHKKKIGKVMWDDHQGQSTRKHCGFKCKNGAGAVVTIFSGSKGLYRIIEGNRKAN